jgi:5-methyltetrahydrofolate--homocysteine methyltransferase
LSNSDSNFEKYISYATAKEGEKKEEISIQNPCDGLNNAIVRGLKEESCLFARELLKEKKAMEIINTVIIPALDVVGKGFEEKKIFLPQLLMSASSAKSAFNVIKEHLQKGGERREKKQTVVIATVKGDIHDIGKNIVKVLLENYGFNVIDLGKDVDYQKVVDAVVKNDIKLVGLSALMTTTLVSMEETIKLLRQNAPDCKVIVGGAVLTPDYAKKIDADFYAKDAKEAVDIAKSVFERFVNEAEEDYIK